MIDGQELLELTLNLSLPAATAPSGEEKSSATAGVDAVCCWCWLREVFGDGVR
ncbi:hypothetical protein S83_026351, partial [Arachis hypogaea]